MVSFFPPHHFTSDRPQDSASLVVALLSNSSLSAAIMFSSTLFPTTPLHHYLDLHNDIHFEKIFISRHDGRHYAFSLNL